jgi:histidinol-phosphate/aromatic aminotransferase/cobyric acid decarboxylase-like protein
MFYMNNLHWLIIGGSKGLGRALAEKVLLHNEKVTIVSRTQPEYFVPDSRYRFIKTDFLVVDERIRLLEFLKHTKKVDRIIYCIGILDCGANILNDLTSFRKIIEGNVWCFLNFLLAAFNSNIISKKHGTFVAAIGSKSAIDFREETIGYSISKLILQNSSEILFNKLPEFLLPKIIIPPRMQTQMNNFSSEFVKPEIVAEKLWDVVNNINNMRLKIIDITNLTSLNQDLQKTPSNKSSIIYKHGENPLGPPITLHEVINSNFSLDFSHFYPDNNELKLEEVLAKNLLIREEEVVAYGGGTSSILRELIRNDYLYGREWIVPTPSFNMVSKWCEQERVVVHQFKVQNKYLLSSKSYKINKILSFHNNVNRTIYIVNPSSPLPLHLTTNDVQKIVQLLKAEDLLIIDEAYLDWAPDTLKETYHLFELRKKPELFRSNNIIALRTFSKGLGLGNLRLGYAYGSEEQITLLKQRRVPMGISDIQAKMCIVALTDKKYLRNSIKYVINEKKKFKLLKNGIKSTFTWNNALLLHSTNGWSERNIIDIRDLGFWPRVVENYPSLLHVYLSDNKSNKELRDYLIFM